MHHLSIIKYFLARSYIKSFMFMRSLKKNFQKIIKMQKPKKVVFLFFDERIILLYIELH